MNKSKIPLIIGLTIPVLMIIFVALSIYLPAMFATPPKYDFLYITGDSGYCAGQRRYTVRDEKVTDLYAEDKKIDVKANEAGANSGIPIPAQRLALRDNECLNAVSRFYLHDTTNNTNKEVSFEDAVKLKLDSNIESPDGFEVIRGSGGDGFPFGFSGDNYRRFYLRGNKLSQKVDLRVSSQDYWNFQFVGWTK